MLKCQVDYAVPHGLCVDNHRTFGSGSAFGGAEARGYQTGCHKVREPFTSRLDLALLAVVSFSSTLMGCVDVYRPIQTAIFGHIYTPLFDKASSPSLG